MPSAASWLCVIWQLWTMPEGCCVLWCWHFTGRGRKCSSLKTAPVIKYSPGSEGLKPKCLSYYHPNSPCTVFCSALSFACLEVDEMIGSLNFTHRAWLALPACLLCSTEDAWHDRETPNQIRLIPWFYMPKWSSLFMLMAHGQMYIASISKFVTDLYKLKLV
jgi:hypothetical protein